MAAANMADFLGGGSAPLAKAKVYPPGEEPNPRNPGGISDNELKRRRAADLKRQADAKAVADRARVAQAEKERRAAKAKADQKAASDALHKRTGGLAGDLKVLGPVVLKAAGTAAAVVATGGAAAGAIGLTAAAGVTAAATTASRVIDAVDTGTKLASSVRKGDVGGIASAAQSGLAQAGIKTPSAAQVGGKVAGTVLSAAKVVVPKNASQAVAEAKKAASTVAATVKKGAAAAQAVTGAAPKIKPPASATVGIPNPSASASLKGPTLNQLMKAALAMPKGSTLQQMAMSAIEKKLPKGALAQLNEVARSTLANVPGAKVVIDKQGRARVETPASTTTAATLFAPQPALSSAQQALQATASLLGSTTMGGAAVVRPNPPASVSIALGVKPPTGGVKPPPMAATTPPPPSPSVLQTAPATRPPAQNDAASSASSASSGPIVEGFLVGLDGRIASDRKWRAA